MKPIATIEQFITSRNQSLTHAYAVSSLYINKVIQHKVFLQKITSEEKNKNLKWYYLNSKWNTPEALLKAILNLFTFLLLIFVCFKTMGHLNMCNITKYV